MIASIEFLIFVIVVFALSVLTKSLMRIHTGFLIIVSMLFYAYLDLRFLPVLVFSILINFIFAKFFDPHKNKSYLFTIIFLNLINLGLFKYTNFTVDSILRFFPNAGDLLGGINILLPLGVSYYTFKTISFHIDRFRGEISKFDIFDYALYISFFPQILSGPITKFNDFKLYIDQNKAYNYDIVEVVIKILSGLFKKLVIASLLFDYFHQAFRASFNYSSVDLLFAAFAFGAFIYADFSGYSDVAEGITKLLGFRIDKNFNSPYRSISIIQFWRRWHISLSTWLKDYLYIPLGGGRLGRSRKYINLFVVMILAGVWHGAGLTFLIWGALHGLALSVNHFVKDMKLSFLKNTVFNIIGFIATFIFINFTWIFFYSRDIQSAFEFLKGIFTNGFGEISLITIESVLLVIFTLLINFFGGYLTNLVMNSRYRIYSWTKIFADVLSKVIVVAIFVGIIVGIIFLIYFLMPDEIPGFLYFDF